MVLFCASAALSLYTPTSIYILITFVLVAFIHPHLRSIFRKIPRVQIVAGLSAALLLIIPLIIMLVISPKFGLQLLAIPTTMPDVWANIQLLASEYFNFASPGGTTAITPFFELGSMLIIAVGIYYVIKTRTSAKNYILILWLIVLVPFLIINPSYTSMTFLPLVLLLASGFSELLLYWYDIFPYNPYARVGGLIPIIILVSVLVLSGVNRYIYEYIYDPNIVPNFSYDLKLIPKDAKNIVVSNQEYAFYEAYAVHSKKDIVVTTEPASDNFIASHDAMDSMSGYNIKNIITSSLSKNSDRFYELSK